jgi:CxxC motif-containing protein (DUF1111 family)
VVIARSAVVILLLLILPNPQHAKAADEGALPSQPKADAHRGRELFERVWTPEKTAKGDGLGPLFNERSCVACHSLGGVGGAGPNSKNVDLLTLVIPGRIKAFMERRRAAGGAFVKVDGEDELAFELRDDRPRVTLATSEQASDTTAFLELERNAERIFSPLRSGGTMLHAFGTDSRYALLREQILGLDPRDRAPKPSAPNSLPEVRRPPGDQPIRTIMHGDITLKFSQRNSTAMFGAGLIDDISSADIQAVADQQARQGSVVSGRFIGRFGWRGQTADLMEFVKGACVLELGLDLEGIAPTPDPVRATLALREQAARARPGKRTAAPARTVVDIDGRQVDDLFVFVKSLPAPGRKATTDAETAAAVAAGERLFSSVGCSDCHRENLGTVTGIYSDLLVHSMGPFLDDPQASPPNPTGGLYYNHSAKSLSELLSQGTDEWRTPPLWGVADSAPYLHDGRAPTIAEAIRLHGGEALSSLDRYSALTPTDRDHLHLFLSSLVAPDVPALKQPLRRVEKSAQLEHAQR